jgi:hypothetical protein
MQEGEMSNSRRFFFDLQLWLGKVKPVNQCSFFFRFEGGAWCWLRPHQGALLLYDRCVPFAILKPKNRKNSRLEISSLKVRPSSFSHVNEQILQTCSLSKTIFMNESE